MIRYFQNRYMLTHGFYLLSIRLLCLIGLLDTAFLAVSHYRIFTDLSYSSFCAISQSINCDTVSQSSWSIFWGIPLAYWGFLGYLAYLVLALVSVHTKHQYKILSAHLLLIALIYSAISIVLGAISAIYIKSFCLLCILSYAINFCLLFLAWLFRRRFPSGNSFFVDLKEGNLILFKKIQIVAVLILLTLTPFLIKNTLPAYWNFTYASFDIEELDTGITKDGHPWIGYKEADLIIEEFSDYQCFQCAKMHYMLRKLISESNTKIKLIHHHYPLDHEFNSIVVRQPFHVGSGKMSLLAIHALYRGKFWQTNDILFELGKQKKSFNTKLLAKKTGLTPGEFTEALSSKKYRKYLNIDVKKGMKHRITETPTFIIDGQKYVGTIPASVLKIDK